MNNEKLVNPEMNPAPASPPKSHKNPADLGGVFVLVM